MLRFGCVLATALICLQVAAAEAAEPLPECADINIRLDASNNHLIRLQPRFRIPDSRNSMLQLAIHPLGNMSNTSSVQAIHTESLSNILVRLHDIQHPALEDLEMVLGHAGHQEILFHGSFVKRGLYAGEGETLVFDSFGEVNHAISAPDTLALQSAVSIHLSELQASNMCLGGTATQKSTGFDGTADRAIDGSLNPFYSNGSVTHTGTDGLRTDAGENPWWQVDLNVSSTIEFVRIFNRQVDDTKSEVQRVFTNFNGPLDAYRDSSFRLDVFVGDNHARTGRIFPAAVATKVQEIGVPGSGAGPGESMQSTLEAVTFINNVLVAANNIKLGGRRLYGAREWRVTFVSALGDIPEMQAVEVQLYGQSETQVQVETIVHGGFSNRYLQQSVESKERLENRLFPFTLAVLTANAAASLPLNASPEELRAAAEWSVEVPKPSINHTSLDSRQWHHHILIPVPHITAQVVRIQLSGTKFLSLSEVQVFAQSEEVLSFNSKYERLVPDSHLRAYGPIRQGFAGSAIHDDWVLTLRDFQAQKRITTPVAQHLALANGAGNIGFWTAELTDKAGVKYQALPNFELRIRSLPQFGRLHNANVSFFNLPQEGYINASSSVQGAEILPAPGMQMFREACSRSSHCSAAGADHGPQRSTSPFGGLVSNKHRLSLLENAFSVVYEPPHSRWTGEDWFTYSAVFGDYESAPARVTVSVAPCREERCDVDPRQLSPAERELWNELHLGEQQVQSSRLQWTIHPW
jgi:hypothetical protein